MELFNVFLFVVVPIVAISCTLVFLIALLADSRTRVNTCLFVWRRVVKYEAGKRWALKKLRTIPAILYKDVEKIDSGAVPIALRTAVESWSDTHATAWEEAALKHATKEAKKREAENNVMQKSAEGWLSFDDKSIGSMLPHGTGMFNVKHAKAEEAINRHVERIKHERHVALMRQMYEDMRDKGLK